MAISSSHKFRTDSDTCVWAKNSLLAIICDVLFWTFSAIVWIFVSRFVKVSVSFVTSFPFANFSAVFAIPSLSIPSARIHSNKSSFASSTSTGVKSSNPLTLMNSAAAFGYTVL